MRSTRKGAFFIVYIVVFFAFFFCACLFNFGWFREQTCTIVCPYGRLQAALLDADTLAARLRPLLRERPGLLAMARAARALARPQATETVARVCMEEAS